MPSFGLNKKKKKTVKTKKQNDKKLFVHARYITHVNETRVSKICKCRRGDDTVLRFGVGVDGVKSSRGSSSSNRLPGRTEARVYCWTILFVRLKIRTDNNSCYSKEFAAQLHVITKCMLKTKNIDRIFILLDKILYGLKFKILTIKLTYIYIQKKNQGLLICRNKYLVNFFCELVFN